ncbi:hypothetical protein SD074_15400 [Prolixibacter sp. SD074]|nr:hypothetical protein SD074_15400 [Prolixibacter sp. SD074]
MSDYLIAGPIGFSEHLNQNLPIGTNPSYAFTPIINIFNFIFGKPPIDVISSYVVYIPTDFSTNVKTFFGTLYVYSGIKYVITSFTLGFIFYIYLLIFIYSIKINIAPLIVTLYSFMMGLLFMGWFDCYIIHLQFYEVPFIAIFLHFLSKLKI